MELNAFDGWMEPQDMLEYGKHCCKRVGHMGTTMVECIAWEKGWDKAYACDV